MAKWYQLLLGVCALAMCPAAAKADPVKIGLITTLSGSSAYLGQDVRDGFMLAVKNNGGKLGGVEVQVLVEDDALDPGKSKQIADRMIKENGVKLITGTVFSNVLLALTPTVLNAGGFVFAPVAGPSQLAGRQCNKNLFIASWQNDTTHEAAGEYANQRGFKKAVILAANYAGGRDSMNGFKRTFKGELLAEVYTKLDQADFGAEIAQIRSLNPDLVYAAFPGGPGINFNKQFVQSGLNKTIQLMVPFASMDQQMMNAVGDGAVGVIAAGSWSPDLDNAENKAFMESFQKVYGRIPTDYAAQAFDAANLIASGLAATKGDVANQDAFRAAIKKADFKSVRGPFSFNTNHVPILDYYARQVAKQPDGKLAIKTIAKVYTGRKDAFYTECKM